MTQLIQPDKRAIAVGELFKVNKKLMLGVVPRVVDPARIYMVALNAVIYNNELLECFGTKVGAISVIGGCMEAMKLGVEIGGALGESWLIPFNDRRAGCKIAVFIVGYKGMRSIAARSGHVLDLMANAVFEGDEYDFQEGDSPYIRHKPARGTPHEPDNLIAVYAVAHLPRGGKQMRWVWREEVDKHRARSRAAQTGQSPWQTDYVPMALKTAVRIIWPFLPRSADMARVERLEDQADRGEPQVFDVTELLLPAALKEPEGPPATAMEQLKDGLRKDPAVPPTVDEIPWGGGGSSGPA